MLLWWMQTPFATSPEQGQGGSGQEAVTRFTSITEAAQDIADNWTNAPRPRLDAQRRTVQHQQDQRHGEHFARLPGTLASCTGPIQICSIA